MWRWGWYFQILSNEYQHWTFPKHNYKRVVTLSVMILDNSEREMISHEIFSCIIFVRFMPQHTIRSYLGQTYLAQITCEIQKLKFASERVKWNEPI